MAWRLCRRETAAPHWTTRSPALIISTAIGMLPLDVEFLEILGPAFFLRGEVAVDPAQSLSPRSSDAIEWILVRHRTPPASSPANWKVSRTVNDVREGISTSLQDIRIGRCQRGQPPGSLWPRTFARDKSRELGSQLASPGENSQPASGPGSGPLRRTKGDISNCCGKVHSLRKARPPPPPPPPPPPLSLRSDSQEGQTKGSC